MELIGGQYNKRCSIMRVRKTQEVQCVKCNKVYQKRVDTMKNWNGECAKCNNSTSKIKGKRRIFYKICKICGKESRWIGTSGKCKSHSNTPISKQERVKRKYLDFRKSVLERDSHQCKLHSSDCSGCLEVHHIRPFVDYPELRFEISNGITLCKKHHPKKREVVDKMAPYFCELIKTQSSNYEYPS